MIYLELFLAFLKVGCFSFGAYAAIPLMQETVIAHGWMDAEMFANIVAISESTPGPIMVNLATYVGSEQAGVWGGAAATLGVILPSFILLLLITSLFSGLMRSWFFRAILRAVKPCLMGVILATGVYMLFTSLTGGAGLGSFDAKAGLILVLLVLIMGGWRKWKRKTFSPILLIGIAACLGGVLY